MSLTQGGGPLGRSTADTNYTIQSPAHKLLFEPDARRLRAYVGDTLVLDTRRAHLLHETGIRPVAYVPLEDFDQALLERTATTSHCPFKGDASYWDVEAGGQRAPNAAWGHLEPLPEASWLEGFVALYWDAMDTWFDEDEETGAHPRDPYTRIDVRRTSRPVEVSV